jgi:hypothetical protein
MNPIDIMKFIGGLLAPHSANRWTILGSDGRLLDVLENEANFIGQSVVVAPPVEGNRGVRNILNARSKVVRNAEIITISLGIELPNPPGVTLGSFVIPQADITWGSGGSLHKATVDVVKGTQITVAASVLTVDGVYYAPIIGADPLPNLRISANIAYGPRGSSSEAPSFTTVGTVDKGGFTTYFTVPEFAKDITVYTEQIVGGGLGPPGNIRVLFVSDDDVAGGTAGAYEQNIDSPRAHGLPGYVRQIAITNLGTVNDIAVTLRFGLSL